MRADLQGTDGSALLVASPDEFRAFVSVDQALSWLKPFAADPANIATLRRALADDVSMWAVSRLTDDEVLREVARRIARACVAVDLHSLPWAAPAEDPAAGSPGEYGDTQDLSEMAEEEAEFEEIKPDPIIPPEYPRLAKLESDQVEFSARTMGFVLDLLRFVGEKLIPDSFVGQALVDLARSAGNGVIIAAGDAGALLAELVASAGAKPPPSAVANTLKGLVTTEAESILLAADRVGIALSNIITGTDAPTVEPSDVGGKLRDEAGVQGRAIVELAGNAGAIIATLLSPSPIVEPGPSEVGQSYGVIAGEQGEALGAAVGRAGEALDTLHTTPGETEPLPASEAGAAFVMEGAVANEALGDAVGRIGSTLDEIKSAPSTPAEPPKKGWARIKLEADDDGLELKNLVVQVTLGGETKLLRTDAEGVLELEGVPEDGFDIDKIADDIGLEVVSVREEGAPSGPTAPAAPTAESPAAEPPPEPPSAPAAPTPPAAPPPAAQAAEPEPEPEPESEPPAPATERPLYPEEDAWLKHTNRIRKARGLPLKTRADIPPEISHKAAQRREQRARRRRR